MSGLGGLALVGVFAGLAAGLLGIGGSIVTIPAMNELFGPDQHAYQAAAMIVSFFVVIPAVYQHVRARAIRGVVVVRLIPPAVVAVIGGVAVSELGWFAGAGEARLRLVFGTFLLCLGGVEVYRLICPGPVGVDERDGFELSWSQAAAVAVPVGFVAGLLGVGGGILSVPLQRRVLRMPMRAAIANSAATILATSFVGAVTKNAAVWSDGAPHRYSPFVLAGVLVVPAMAAAFYGARLTHTVPRRGLLVVFLMVLCVAALRLIWFALLDLPGAGA